MQRALDAAITGMLVPRYQLPDGRWVQTVNMLQYHAFWIRDTAVIADALDRVGLSTPAADDLAFLSDWQTPDGTFVSRIGQGDGFGQALWALGQHVRLTGDAAFAKQWAPAVDRAVNWATATIAATPTGLLPPSDPKDNEWVAGTLTGDQLWGVAGLDAAAALATSAGDTGLRNRALAARNTLRTRLVSAMRLTAVNGRLQPTLDGQVGTSWGERWAAWPFPTLAPTDPLVQSSLQADLAGSRRASPRTPASTCTPTSGSATGRPGCAPATVAARRGALRQRRAPDLHRRGVRDDCCAVG